jgi:hypothetical protein
MSKYGGCREEGARAGLPRFEIRPNIFDTPVLGCIKTADPCRKQEPLYSRSCTVSAQDRLRY